MRFSLVINVLLLCACSVSKPLNDDYAITDENDFTNSTYGEQKGALQAYYFNQKMGKSTLVLYRGKKYLMSDFSKKFNVDDVLQGEFSIIKDAGEIAKYSNNSTITTLIKIDAKHQTDQTTN